jgi:CrcB protein
MEAPSTALKLGVVFLGAGLGGILRYSVTLACIRLAGQMPGASSPSPPPLWGLPVGTIVVNITGCFAIGVLGTLLAGPGAVRETWRLALMVGLLGGYTTFSAFGRETFLLLQEGKWGGAAANVLLSNLLGIAAVFLGHWIAARVAAHLVK